ncbi:Mlp family lipoprotein (plasmid) [Borrelia puertoricensis]|uniref:Mlp family lipoprotein n=1 Tax=Borrelia puertoricensis TaxID=2756107 RepID=UPI001FF4F9E1|nr:Mlp family lipoprotein [Borrelia puertoricensis]UPA18447.1 Mlp family lipoprotein [Borrelia puertoricensis]
MNKINFILILLLLMSSCEWFDSYKDIKSRGRSKREVNSEQTEKVQKTPEEALKEKLNDNQKSNLDFLKEALGDKEKFNQLLTLDEEKIKAALEHIHTELEKCNGNDEGKSTFKQVVKGYFSKMDESTLNDFKNQATSTCQVGAGS